jgi:hypothetical protein
MIDFNPYWFIGGYVIGAILSIVFMDKAFNFLDKLHKKRSKGY